MAAQDRSRRNSSAEAVRSIDNPDGSSGRLFAAAIVLVLIAGVAGVVALAAGRESNVGVAPEAGIDHWHSAILINNCQVDLPPTNEFASSDGIHTHGDGLLHIHPFNPGVAGRNATLGTYIEAYGGTITDDSYISGFADPVQVAMTEESGCEGTDATLQLAVWDNAFDDGAEPRIITEGLADFRFDTAGMAITLALLPDGVEPPKPPAEQIATLLQVGPGGPIAGVEAGQSPLVSTIPEPTTETTVEAPADDADTESGADDADDG